MSLAWKEPVVLWKEPALGTAVRIVGRAFFVFLWLTAALVAPSAWWQGAALVLAAFALAHTLLAIANRLRSRGVVLRLMGSGAVEWFPSLQEGWLNRPVDFVDGTDVRVIVEPKFPIFAFTDPRVTLRGDTARIERLPLYRVSPERFIAAVNAAAEGRVTFHADGTGPAVEARKAARRGMRRTGKPAEGA